MTISVHTYAIAAIGVALWLTASHAQAASLREVIRTCGDDGKKLCEGVGYGQPMQTCLSSKKPQLTNQCRALIERLDSGETVTLF